MNGHIIVKGSDLGAPSAVAFRAALNDSLSGRQISPGFMRALQDVGWLYCWEKKEHPEKSDPDLVQATTAEFHNHFKPRNADEVVQLDVAAALAEKTWCPLGLPNPVTKPPEFPANSYQ
ncbi:MAG TPA: hypothetical protein VHA33_14715 [Candidatus Angelobacter sp.]|nr:hypothetical protein [Candidatus Angelobacter sp.]